MSTTVTVSLLSVELISSKIAVVTIGGAQPTSISVGAAAGRRIFDELTKIRAALVAAHAVLVQPGRNLAVTPEDVHLAHLLVDLEIVPS